jgi:hypothetical protein
VIDVSFTAPTEADAKALEAEWIAYLSAPWEAEAVPPWLPYYSGQRDSEAERLRFLSQVYLSERSSNSNINTRLYYQIETAQAHQEFEKAEQLKQDYEKLYQQGQIHLTRDEYHWVKTAVEITEIDKDIDEDLLHREYEITRHNAQVVVKNICNWGSLVKLLVAITAWLKDQQCTDIDFRFTELAG